MVFLGSKQKNKEILVIIVLLLIFIVSSTLFLDRFPKVWMDEAWDSTTAYTFQLDGTFRNLALVSENYGNQNVHFLQPRLFPNVVMAPFFYILGIGSIPGRLASVFMGGLTIIGMYLLARRIGGQLFAIICTLFLIFDNLFFVVTRTIRPEIYVTAIALWAIFLILGKVVVFWRLFIGGVLIGISLYSHPNSALVAVSIFLMALSQVKFREYGKILFPLVLGVIVGFLPYVSYVWVQDSANQFHDFWFQIQHRAEMLTDAGSFFSGALTAEIERYKSYIFFPYRLPIFLIQILAVVNAIFKKDDKINRPLLIFIFTHVVLFPILISAKTSRYMTVLMPIVTLLVVKMIWEIAGWSYETSLQSFLSSVSKPNRATIISVFLGLVLFVNQAGGNAWAVWQSRDFLFSPFISQVRELVPSDEKVWGPMTFWFGFYDHPYRTQWTINTAKGMSDYQPDYVVLYDEVEIWARQTGVTKRNDPNYEKMESVRELLTGLVEERGKSIGVVPSSCYGNVEIFMLDWQ